MGVDCRTRKGGRHKSTKFPDQGGSQIVNQLNAHEKLTYLERKINLHLFNANTQVNVINI